ncbi:hypothetical protein [Massilia sp. DD77]|uniref:hypothetical protein n=1 Tax=Massilia sp. DD77 TaxID=3109349 RepID=UPI002FFFB0E1
MTCTSAINLANPSAPANLKSGIPMDLQGGDAERRLAVMFNVLVFGILSGLVGIVAFQAIEAIRSGSDGLYDHYHQ